WKAAEVSSQNLNAVLIGITDRTKELPLLLVFLGDGDRAGDGVADIDRLQILKRHLSRQKADHPADVRGHTGRQQSRNVASPEPALAGEEFVLMVRIEISRHADEERNITFGERAAVSEYLPDLQRVKSFTELLFEIGCGVSHMQYWPTICREQSRGIRFAR